MDAGVHEGADRRKRLRLREDFRVRADADLEILAPGALGDEHLLEVRSLARAGLELGEILAHEAHDLAADRGGAFGVAARPLLDHALEHRDGEGDARGLDGLQIDGREEPGLCGIAPLGRRVGEELRESAERFALGAAQGLRGMRLFAEIAHRREARRDVENAFGTNGDDGRPAELGPPDAAGERRIAMILGKRVPGREGKIEMCRHRACLSSFSRSGHSGERASCFTRRPFTRRPWLLPNARRASASAPPW